jgi:hypothetical protein
MAGRQDTVGGQLCDDVEDLGVVQELCGAADAAAAAAHSGLDDHHGLTGIGHG